MEEMEETQIESTEELYKVSIKGVGVTIEKSVPARVARQMINAIMGDAAPYEPVSSQEMPVARNPLGTGYAPAAGGHKTSLREFLDESRASRNPDKITAIAQYIFVHEGADLFTRNDIKGRFRTAGEAAPANFTRDFTWAVKNGWVAEDAKSSGSFYVTKKGGAAIKNKFSDEIKKGTAQPSGRKRSRKAPFAEDDAG
jgi:hypothetical protein